MNRFRLSVRSGNIVQLKVDKVKQLLKLSQIILCFNSNKCISTSKTNTIKK